MSQTQQSIQCPTSGCNGTIVIDTYMLLNGATFSCPQCKVTIGLAAESRNVVSDTMDKFEDLKRNIQPK